MARLIASLAELDARRLYLGEGLTAEPAAPSKKAAAALFDFVDPAVDTGQWTWAPGPRGLVFKPRRKRR